MWRFISAARTVEYLTEICIASRTVAKCEALKEKLEKTTDTKITTAQVDARQCGCTDRG